LNISVEHGHHPCGALGQQVRRRDPVGDARVADLALRPGQALGHGRLGDQESARDLRGGQAAERAQRERDPCVERERGVAAGEDQPEPVVHDPALVRGSGGEPAFVLVGEHGGLPQLRGLDLSAAQHVERAVARGRGEPGGRIARDPGGRPVLEGLRERVLHALLGQVPVAGQPDQPGHEAAPLLGEDQGEGRLGA
jgi:hypothetical protein